MQHSRVQHLQGHIKAEIVRHDSLFVSSRRQNSCKMPELSLFRLWISSDWNSWFIQRCPEEPQQRPYQVAKVGVCDHNEERPTKAQHWMCCKKYITDRFLQGSPKWHGTYTAHAFHASWQPHQLAQLLPNLKQDEVVAVMDFSENYHCTHQNEVQTAYFSPCEVTLHPMMFYYKAHNDDDKEILAKFAIIGISNDPQHDTALMQQFKSKALDLSQYMTVKRIIEFTDGCAAQYKGHLGFADISLQQGQLEQHFFETSHSKNMCNGLGALLKNYCYQAVISRKAVLGSAIDVYHYATSHCLSLLNWQKKLGSSGWSELSAWQYIYIEAENVNHDDKNLDVQTLQGTQKLHAIKNTGQPYKVCTWNLSFFCAACEDRAGGVRSNKEYVGKWENYQLILTSCILFNICSTVVKYKIAILIRSFVCNTKRPSVKQSMKWQVSSNLADKPSLADLPPCSKLLDKKVTAMHFHTINENSFETVNL